MRYELLSRWEREANNELKAGLLGSDRPIVSTIQSPVTRFCLGVMSASEMRDLSSEKRFP